MKTSKPLLWGEFSFQEFTTDYNDLILFFDEIDSVITEPALDVVKRFEKDREVTIELWRKELFLEKNADDPNIRLANLFEVCAFANRFTRAHIKHGKYVGFDSVAGRVMSNHHYPVVGETWIDCGSTLHLYSLTPEELPDHCLVITKEKLL